MADQGRAWRTQVQSGTARYGAEKTHHVLYFEKQAFRGYQIWYWEGPLGNYLETAWTLLTLSQHPLSVSYLISSKHLLFINNAHVGYFSIFVIDFVCKSFFFLKERLYFIDFALSQFLNGFPSLMYRGRNASDLYVGYPMRMGWVWMEISVHRFYRAPCSIESCTVSTLTNNQYDGQKYILSHYMLCRWGPLGMACPNNRDDKASEDGNMVSGQYEGDVFHRSVWMAMLRHGVFV